MCRIYAYHVVEPPIPFEGITGALCPAALTFFTRWVNLLKDWRLSQGTPTFLRPHPLPAVHKRPLVHSTILWMYLSLPYSYF